jgi:hypothetical protein
MDLQSNFYATWKPTSDKFQEIKGGRTCKRCDKIGFVQITTTTDATFSGLLGSARAVLTNHAWAVDPGIAYGNVHYPNPMPGSGIGNTVDPTARNAKISMGDAPGFGISLPFFGTTLEHVTQKFETCVACLGGNEGPGRADTMLMPFERMTVYGCVTWHHEFTRQPNGTYKVNRVLDGESARSETQPVTKPYDYLGSGPTDNFIDAVGKYYDYYDSLIVP